MLGLAAGAATSTLFSGGFSRIGRRNRRTITRSSPVIRRPPTALPTPILALVPRPVEQSPEAAHEVEVLLAALVGEVWDADAVVDEAVGDCVGVFDVVIDAEVVELITVVKSSGAGAWKVSSLGTLQS